MDCRKEVGIRRWEVAHLAAAKRFEMYQSSIFSSAIALNENSGTSPRNSLDVGETLLMSLLHDLLEKPTAGSYNIHPRANRPTKLMRCACIAVRGRHPTMGSSTLRCHQTLQNASDLNPTTRAGPAVAASEAAATETTVTVATATTTATAARGRHRNDEATKTMATVTTTTNTQTHTHAQARAQHTYSQEHTGRQSTHTYTRTHTHTRAHARTHPSSRAGRSHWPLPLSPHAAAPPST